MLAAIGRFWDGNETRRALGTGLPSAARGIVGAYRFGALVVPPSIPACAVPARLASGEASDRRRVRR